MSVAAAVRDQERFAVSYDYFDVLTNDHYLELRHKCVIFDQLDHQMGPPEAPYSVV